MIDFDSEDFIKNFERKITPEKKFLEEIYEKHSWDSFLSPKKPYKVTFEIREAFHSLWIEKGHFIREKMNDDKKLVELLKTLFPTYIGDGMFLYRGENIQRYKSNKIGFCWTTNIDVARKFASGLNAYKSGGFLLCAKVEASEILAGIHPHSIYLEENEVTVNPFHIKNIKVLEVFPEWN
jgi:hypothetical protein